MFLIFGLGGVFCACLFFKKSMFYACNLMQLWRNDTFIDSHSHVCICAVAWNPWRSSFKKVCFSIEQNENPVIRSFNNNYSFMRLSSIFQQQLQLQEHKCSKTNEKSTRSKSNWLRTESFFLEITTRLDTDGLYKRYTCAYGCQVSISRSDCKSHAV